MGKKVTQHITDHKPAIPDVKNAEQANFNIWQDTNMVKLIEALVSDKITDIKPVIDISRRNAVSYPSIRSLVQTAHTTIDLLDTLAEADILRKTLFEKLFVDPDGSYQLIPVERCPHCDSANLESGRLLEHYSCGNIEFEYYYLNDSKLICPKCHSELKLLGTDYCYLGNQYRCLDCENLSATAVIKWRNLQTGKVWTADRLSHVPCFSFELNTNKKSWLQFQLKPKKNLVDFLKIRGYDVCELAEVKGSSGAVHTIDILATRDDVLAKLRFGIVILTAHDNNPFVSLEDVFRFDTTTYDLNLEYKAIVAIPKLTEEAKMFAERQKIKVFEIDDINDLMFHIEEQATPLSLVSMNRKTSETIDNYTTSEMLDAPFISEKVTTYLQNRGYAVTEGKKVKGKSGIEYNFDIYAQREDLVIQPSIGIDIGINDLKDSVDLNTIIQFDAKTYDTGTRNRTFIAIPKATIEAQQFAKRQQILIIDWLDLNRIFQLV